MVLVVTKEKRTAEDITVTKQEEKPQVNEVQQKLVDQKKGLTCDKDTNVLTVKYCKQPNMFLALNPFMEQTPYQILTRQYKIADISITPGFGQDQFAFPQRLFVIPAIEKALSSFYYFRADLEISVKLNTTPYHQGMLMCTFLHDTAYDQGYNNVQRSALAPIVLNYSSSDSVTMQMGWLHPQAYMKLVWPFDANKAYIGNLSVTQIDPIANTSGGGTTCTCTLYARFLNPRVAGFTTQAPSVQGQSGRAFKFAYAPETDEKSETRLPTSNTTEPILSPLFKAIPLVEGVATTVLDLFTHLTKTLDKPMDVAVPMKMQYGIGSDNIQGAGLQTADRLTLYPTSRLASFPISDSCFNSNQSVISIAQQPMLFDRFVFDSTNTIYNLYPHPMSVGSLGYEEINEVSSRCSPDFLAYIAGMHRFWKGGIKYLLYFVTNSFTTARFRISYIIDYQAEDLGYGGDFPSQIVDVKGSTINKITVPYMWQTPYRSLIPTGVDPNDGFQLTPKVTIELLSLPVASQGASPYISLIVFRAAAEDFQVASPASSQIDPFYMHPTSEMSSVQRKKKRKEKTKDVIGQTSIQDEFAFAFPAISCNCKMIVEQGFTTTETTGKVDDLLKRFAKVVIGDGPQVYQTRPLSYASGAANQQFVLGPDESATDPYKRQPYYQLLQLFKYQRGSMRFRWIQGPDETTPPDVYITPAKGTVDIGSGDLIWLPRMNPVQTIEAPWIGTVPYLPTDTGPFSIVESENMEIVEFETSSLANYVNYLASGDDRLYSYLLPPGRFLYAATPAAPVSKPAIREQTTSKSQSTRPSNRS